MNGRLFDQTDLLKVSEAAALLRVSESTIRRACREGRINWFRVRQPHGAIRIPIFGLEDLIGAELLRQAHEATKATAPEPT
jgi:excisionase family DNA binding protein